MATPKVKPGTNNDDSKPTSTSDGDGSAADKPTLAAGATSDDPPVPAPARKKPTDKPPVDDDADEEGGDGVGLAERTSLLTLDFAEKVDLAEKRVPFLTTGSWHFDEYGEFTVGRHDLAEVKRLFDEGARKQDLPVNEHHNPTRAVGWVKSLEFNGDDRLDAVVSFNAVGDRLLAEDQYRYASPELLRNWTDPETRVSYPLIATGHSITNKPKLKALGRIAASETAPGCSLIACAEKDFSAATPADARALLMADLDNDGDDDGPVPQCIYQPPNAAVGCCIAFTRRGDADGDGTCLLAERGCNGYVGVTPLPLVPLGNSWSPSTIATYGESPQPKRNPQMPEPQTTPEAPAAQPAAEDKSAVLMAENAKLSAQAAEAEQRNVQLAERVAAMERRETLSGIKAEFAELVRTGRVSPAEVEKFIGEDDNAIKLSENAFVLDALKARPANSAINLTEKGAPGDDAPTDAHQQLVSMAEEIRSKSEGANTPTFEQAYAAAVEKNPQLYAELRSAQNARTRVMA